MTWLFALAFAGFVGPNPLRLVVNIPAYRLEAYVNDTLVRTIDIAPGMPRYPTPRGGFAITGVEWNPWWIPPKSRWAAKERPTPPGPGNPMGRVKLNFRPLYFLHGSPFEQSIGTAASHGCFRLKNEDAIELARLVHRVGTPALSASDIEMLASDTASRTIDLDVSIPLEIRYELVEVRNGRVSLYRDVYGLASRSLEREIRATLAAAGMDTLTIDASRLRGVVRNVPARGRSISVDSLFGRETKSPAPRPPTHEETQK